MRICSESIISYCHVSFSNDVDDDDDEDDDHDDDDDDDSGVTMRRRIVVCMSAVSEPFTPYSLSLLVCVLCVAVCYEFAQLALAAQLHVVCV